ncbi:Holliday junction branch migration protein RuvA [Metamycoplasma faucium]|uniref:Holliday junction branch migration complex subunit RuvA n=1 Tax=Metamycoplasma faucium TaxID=56142 RepID=A0ABZ2TM00_9BACT
MTIYKYGKIMHVNTNYLILDHNGNGELIYVPNIERFKKDEVRKVFISSIENEYSKTTYGFENFKELVLFEDLISLQGLGPKTAISILNEGWEKIINLIADGNKDELEKINYVSSRVANNIVSNYQSKYAKFVEKLVNGEDWKAKNKVSNSYNNQFEETMKMLGFKTQQIKYALEKIKITENIEQCVEDAIKLISQNQHEIRV